jgi:dienelactone hydrolase
MRKLILSLLLFCSLFANSQVDYFTLQKDNGTYIGVAEYLAPANPNGKLDPVFIWLHGIDANRSAPSVPSDLLRVAVVTNKGPLRMVRDGIDLPLFQKPGTTLSGDRYRWNIVAPQNRTGEWDCEIVQKTMAYIRANPSKWDTSLIILVGYSLGGGGVRTCLKSTGVIEYVKYAVDIAGGYPSRSPNFAALASSGIPYDLFFTVNDELVNESIPDAFINSWKAAGPIVIPNYIRFSDVTTTYATTNPEHDYIEVLIARDTTNGDTQLTTNGDTWTKTENIYQRGLRFFGPRRQAN